MLGVQEYDQSLFKQKRELLGLSIGDLAEACHLSKQTMYNLENNKKMSRSTILLIGLVLDILADDQGKLVDFYSLENSE